MTRSNIQQANKGDLKAVKTKEQSDTRVEGIKPIDNYYKHLTSHQRLLIWMGIKDNKSLKNIAFEIGKDPTTVSKEVKNNRYFKPRNPYTRSVCTVCLNWQFCVDKKGIKCESYKEEVCQRLLGFPWVCDGCLKKNCKFNKYFYNYQTAQEIYKNKLTNSRVGIRCDEEQFKTMNAIVSNGVLKGQSINHIVANNKDTVFYSDRHIYNLVSSRKFKVGDIDLPRKVRYKPRKGYSRVQAHLSKSRWRSWNRIQQTRTSQVPS